MSCQKYLAPTNKDYLYIYIYMGALRSELKLPETAVNKVGSMKDTTVLKCHYLLSTSRPVTSSFLFQSRTSLAFFSFCLWFSLFGAFSAHGTFAAQPSETLGMLESWGSMKISGTVVSFLPPSR